MLRTEIGINEQLFPGETIEMHFKVYGPNWTYLRAAELSMLIYRLERKNPDWELTAWDSTTYPNKLVLTFKILKSNPVVVTAAIIAAIVIGGGLFAWLALDKVTKFQVHQLVRLHLPVRAWLLLGLYVLSLILCGNNIPGVIDD